jgi:hypothetical protein
LNAINHRWVTVSGERRCALFTVRAGLAVHSRRVRGNREISETSVGDEEVSAQKISWERITVEPSRYFSGLERGLVGVPDDSLSESPSPGRKANGESSVNRYANCYARPWTRRDTKGGWLVNRSTFVSRPKTEAEAQSWIKTNEISPSTHLNSPESGFSISRLLVVVRQDGREGCEFHGKGMYARRFRQFFPAEIFVLCHLLSATWLHQLRWCGIWILEIVPIKSIWNRPHSATGLVAAYWRTNSMMQRDNIKENELEKRGTKQLGRARMGIGSSLG